MKGSVRKRFGESRFYEWLHVRLADSFDEMTNLSKALRESWKRSMRSFPWNWQPDRSRNWTGRTILFRLRDGNMVESVLMRYKHRQFGLHFLRSDAGWAGILCVDDRRVERNLPVGNARADLSDPEDDQGSGFPTLSLWGTGNRWIIMRTF